MLRVGTLLLTPINRAFTKCSALVLFKNVFLPGGDEREAFEAFRVQPALGDPDRTPAMTFQKFRAPATEARRGSKCSRQTHPPTWFGSSVRLEGEGLGFLTFPAGDSRRITFLTSPRYGAQSSRARLDVGTGRGDAIDGFAASRGDYPPFVATPAAAWRHPLCRAVRLPLHDHQDEPRVARQPCGWPFLDLRPATMPST